MRSLLHQVLTQHPDAIAELFSKHWDPTYYDLWIEPERLHLETKEVVVAFGRLLSEPEICEHAKFCLFLDGLDEYEDELRTSQHLVTSLLKWVDLADGRLKLLVSSRELPAFQQNLPVNQRIRLHELTSADILAVTRQTLEAHPEFRRRQGHQHQECSSLVQEIVEKSDGVFLWVTLTLKLAMQSLEDGESTATIRKQVDVLPEELEDFFYFIITSIPKHQRRKAYCSLQYLSHMFRHLSQKRLSSGRVHPNGEREQVLSMFRLSFLDEYLDDEGFAYTLDFTPLDEEATLRRIATATAQIQARSRGLWEPWEPNHIQRGMNWSEGSSVPQKTPKPARSRVTVARSMTVRYTHRSIHEFLVRFLNSNFVKPYVDGFDCIKAQISNFIALIKYSEFKVEFYDGSEGIGHPRNELWNLVLEVQEAPNPKHHFGSLDILEDTMCKIYATHFVHFDRLRWEVYRSTALTHSDTSARPETIRADLMGIKKQRLRLPTPLYLGASASFHQYIYWKLETCPDAWRGSDGAELLFVVLLGGIVPPCYPAVDISSKLHVLREVLKLGGNPNFAFRSLDGGDVGTHRGTPWVSFLHFVFGSPLGSTYAKPEAAMEWECGRWSVIEIMLEFGALPPFWKATKIEDEPGLLVTLTVGDRTYNTFYHLRYADNKNRYSNDGHFLLLQSTRDIFEGRDFITMRDVVHHFKAHNARQILELLGQWEKVHGPVGPKPPPNGEDEGTMPHTKDLDEEPDRGQEEQVDGCDAEAALLASSEEDSACASEQSAHSEASSDIDKGPNSSSRSEEELGPAPTPFRKRFVEVVTHPLLPWLLVGK